MGSYLVGFEGSSGLECKLTRHLRRQTVRALEPTNYKEPQVAKQAWAAGELPAAAGKEETLRDSLCAATVSSKPSLC